jgi:hypothetical protein
MNRVQGKGSLHRTILKPMAKFLPKKYERMEAA